MANAVYKILSQSAFVEAKRAGQFSGSSDDIRNGFIHLSAAHQLAGTLAKHFAGRDGLMLLALDPERLGPALKWEASRGGDLFPHLYAPLALSAVLWAEPLRLGVDGIHRLPEGVAA